MREERKFQKQDKEARKLEVLEQELLKRLRDTHVKHKETIEDVQEMLRSRGGYNTASTPLPGDAEELV